MAAKVRLGDSTPEPQEQIEVELWERVYATRPVTRSVEQQLEELDRRLEAAADSDEAMRVFGQLLDCLLVPTGSQKKRPGAVLEEKWKADKLSLGKIAAFVEQVQELAQGQRPT